MLSFWANATGLARIAFFILAYACLFFASHAALDEKWVGMASALPLPGFFALASLIDGAEEKPASLAALRGIRDTLFLGPLLVIPFNWAFAHALIDTFAPGASIERYALLFCFWAIAATLVGLLVPRVAAYLDSR